MHQEKDKLVSVIIPAYNRPHYLEQALISAVNQTYKNIEIIVCDDSTNNGVQEMIQPFLKNFPNMIKYYKNEKNLFLDNWQRCLDLSSGDYINYLMDDDIFHSQKIEKMVSYFLQNEDIKLVTSSRKLIDKDGNFLPPLKATLPLFKETTILDGKLLGNYALTSCLNIIGEGTTVLFRKKDLTENFGTYNGKRYCCLNDLASWLSLLSKGKAVYICKSLSYFRIHPGQNSGTSSISLTAVHEWLDLILDSRVDGYLDSTDIFRAALYKHKSNVQQLAFSKNDPLYEIQQNVLMRIQSVLSNI